MISALLTNIQFELAIRKKQISTYVYFLVFFAIGLIVTLAAGGAFKGLIISFVLSDKILVNSPMILHLFVSYIGCLGLFIIAPIFGQSIYKDYGANIDQIIFSTSTHRRGF